MAAGLPAGCLLADPGMGARLNDAFGGAFHFIGFGLWFHLSQKVAINAGLKALFPIPTFSLGFAPEAGLIIGL